MKKAGRNRVTVKVGPDVAKPKRKGRGGTTHFYWRFLEFGAQAHEITVKVKKALKIGDNIRPKAKHPGIRAQPFMRPAFDKKQDEAEKKVAQVLRRKLGL